MSATAESQRIAPATRLSASQLCRRCDVAQLPFATTVELPDTPLVFGQDRAVAAIRFGIGMRRDGYNLFALGPAGAGKHAVVRKFLEEQAASEPQAPDRDLVTRALSDATLNVDALALGDVMTAQPIAAREQDNLWDAIKKMRSFGVRRLVVVNDRGGLEGILSVDDVIDLLAEELSDLRTLVAREQQREVEHDRGGV